MPRDPEPRPAGGAHPGRSGLRIAHGARPDLSDLAGELDGPLEAVFLFVSPALDLQEVAAAADARWGSRVVGCTTAGEIGPRGMGSGGIVAAGIPADLALAEILVIDPVVPVDGPALAGWRRRLLARARGGAMAAVLLVDGLCQREEILCAELEHHLAGIPLVGGSAGDDFQFRAAPVLAAGSFRTGRAVLVGLACMPGVEARPFQIQDFTPISGPLVITDADPVRRLITEIDGEPAAQFYARRIGSSPERLTADDFAMNSMMLTLGGEVYIRSVRGLAPDGGLIMHSAIDEGMVVRLGRSGDTGEGIRRRFVAEDLLAGAPAGVLLFDCMHRRLELRRQGHLAEIAGRLAAAGAVGFTTYGEISGCLHVNQTCSGLVFARGTRA
jgi:hypothetical protein